MVAGVGGSSESVLLMTHLITSGPARGGGGHSSSLLLPFEYDNPITGPGCGNGGHDHD